MLILFEDLFIGLVEVLICVDSDWMLIVDGVLIYLCFFMFVLEVFLGVKLLVEYLYFVIVSLLGNYWKGGVCVILIWVLDYYMCVVFGGIGVVKCGGNYVVSLIVQVEVMVQGCDQVVFFDVVECCYVEELGGMNVFFVFDDGLIVILLVLGMILEGIMCDLLLMLVCDEGLMVCEEFYVID